MFWRIFLVATLVNYVDSFLSVTFCGYRRGWMVLSMYLVFYVGCHILLFLWAMNWGIEIMAPAVVFVTRMCFTYNWIWINVCTLDNPLFMRDPMCCDFIGG